MVPETIRLPVCMYKESRWNTRDKAQTTLIKSNRECRKLSVLMVVGALVVNNGAPTLTTKCRSSDISDTLRH